MWQKYCNAPAGQVAVEIEQMNGRIVNGGPCSSPFKAPYFYGLASSIRDSGENNTYVSITDSGAILFDGNTGKKQSNYSFPAHFDAIGITSGRGLSTYLIQNSTNAKGNRVTEREIQRKHGNRTIMTLRTPLAGETLDWVDLNPDGTVAHHLAQSPGIEIGGTLTQVVSRSVSRSGRAFGVSVVYNEDEQNVWHSIRVHYFDTGAVFRFDLPINYFPVAAGVSPLPTDEVIYSADMPGEMNTGFFQVKIAKSPS